MNRSPRLSSMLCALAAMVTLLFLGAVGTAASAAVPRAQCRAADRTETGLQGQTTQAEVDSGANQLGFNCNADLVGQYQGEGASWQLAAWKTCAYFDQRLNPAEAHPGTVVMDVSDPANPRPTMWLNDNAMLDPWESLKVNPARQLLAAAQRPGTGFAVYDISQDCARPVAQSLINVPGMFAHTGQWAPDGNTYYVTPLRADQSLIVLDTSDATRPALIPCAAGSFGCASNGFFVAPLPLSPRLNDLELSKDGNTAYLPALGTGAAAVTNGLLILDVSDFQSRRANPAFRVLSSLTWDDGSVGAHHALPITVAGRPFVLVTDQSGAQAPACAQGKSANGCPRLIDVSDPTSPMVVSKLMLEVSDPANCSTIVSGVPIFPTGPGPFGYSCNYCSVDDPADARLAACSCFAAGLRVFDIRDPLAPREVAYYKPPAQGTKALPASQLANSVPAGFTRQFDWTTAKVSFPKDRGATSGDLWLTSQDNGFLVVRLDPSVLPPQDTTPPVTSAALMPTANPNGWNNTPVDVVLTASDEAGGSGVKSIEYILSGAQGEAGVVDGPIAHLRISNDGTTTLTFFATDRAGNQESKKQRVVQIDTAAPVIAGLPAGCVLWPPDHRLVPVADIGTSDSLSGIDLSSFSLQVVSNEPGEGDILVTGGAVSVRAERLGAGTGREYDIEASVSDRAGNFTRSRATCVVPHDRGH